ncbi:MAG: hypothetical protein OQJ84_00675, partial [Xanthomonadales bacterium]|nr:hypothetical protein [Xanthomonadales bacterium]
MNGEQRLEMKDLGWSDWFAERAECKPPDTIARVASVDRDQLLLLGQTGTFRARLAGSFRHHQPGKLPCVGDWVCIEKHPGDDFGLVRSLLPRRTMLRRRSA